MWQKDAGSMINEVRKQKYICSPMKRGAQNKQWEGGHMVQ